MTAAAAIPAAIIARYRAGAFFTDQLTAWENAAFVKPITTSGTPWAALFHIPAAQSPLSLSTSNENTGLVQIDLNYPLDIGAGAALAKADAIGASFKRGTILASLVEITAFDLSQGRVVDGWYRVSLSISYRAFVPI